jgi:intracellular sulfur oxidation DsrE/DsrF family protein
VVLRQYGSLRMDMNRKQFLVRGLTGAAALAAGAMAQGQLVDTRADWRERDFRRLMARPARYRQVYDIVAINHGIFLNNIKNSLNGFQFGLDLTPRQFHIVAALHGPANLLNLDDAAWARYPLGEFIGLKDPKTGRWARRNLFLHGSADARDHDPDSERSVYQDKSITGLKRRGVSFLACHTAMEEQSRAMIARFRLQEKPEAMVRTLLGQHLLPGTFVVAAMVMAVALLQTDGHFSYITVP